MLDGAAAAVLVAAAFAVVPAGLDVLLLELPHPANASTASGAAPTINLLFT